MIISNISSNTIPLSVAQGLGNNINIKNNSEFLTYINANYGLKIQYPSMWTPSTTGLRNFDDIIAFYAPFENITDQYTAKVTVSITPFLNNVSFDQFTNLTITSLNNTNTSRIIEKSTDTISGHTGYKVIYHINNLPNFLTMEAWTTIGNKVVHIEYRAPITKFDYYFGEVEHMIHSIDIKS